MRCHASTPRTAPRQARFTAGGRLAQECEVDVKTVDRWLREDVTVPNLREVLSAKAQAGARIRFLLGDPDSPITRQRETVEAVPLSVSARIAITLGELDHLNSVPNIETRFSDQHISLSVWTFDDQAGVSTHIASLVGHDSPTCRFRRRAKGGMFDAYAGHVEALWQSARPASS